MESHQNGDLMRMRDLYRALDSQIQGDSHSSEEEALTKQLQIYKTASRKLADYQEALSWWYPNYSFLKVVSRLVHLLRECLVCHRWPEALQVVHALCTEKERTSSAIWKVGLSCLYQGPDTNMAMLDKFVNHVSALRDLSPVEVLLDHLFYLMVQGHTEDAKELIHVWKRDQLLMPNLYVNARRKMAKQLFLLYQGLILFAEWKAMAGQKQRDSREEMYPIDMYGTYEDFAPKPNQFLADGVIELLADIADTSGVWDMFVTALVEVYETQDLDQAHTLLQKYREKNPDNPNSHRYLYQFEVKHKDEVNVDCLKNIVEHDPGNPLALKLCRHLDDQEAVTVVFDYLDFSLQGDKGHEEGWDLLNNFLLRIHKHPELHETILDLWSCRKDWWPQTVLSEETEFSQTQLKVKEILTSLDSSTNET